MSAQRAAESQGRQVRRSAKQALLALCFSHLCMGRLRVQAAVGHSRQALEPEGAERPGGRPVLAPRPVLTRGRRQRWSPVLCAAAIARGARTGVSLTGRRVCRLHRNSDAARRSKQCPPAWQVSRPPAGRMHQCRPVSTPVHAVAHPSVVCSTCAASRMWRRVTGSATRAGLEVTAAWQGGSQHWCPAAGAAQPDGTRHGACAGV